MSIFNPKDEKNDGAHAVACINDEQGLRVWDPNGGITIISKEGDPTESLSIFLFHWFVRTLENDFRKISMFSNVEPTGSVPRPLQRGGKVKALPPKKKQI